MKKELIGLARKGGVTVRNYYANDWLCFVILEDNNVKHIKGTATLSILIKFLSDNKIKINN